ncbi:MAG: homocysteine S-methyltransferase family protein [Bacteroidota bacterium]|jgi:5-methyltetrahydrofolate--homocysteine methyltransferase|nr:homocysteine S-methyltransferase family protein [Bacteroidota bacterium]
MDTRFLDALARRVLVFDGATGTNLQTQNLTAEDFGGAEFDGCNEYLVLTKPSAVEHVHRDFLEAGADIIETNSFGSTRIVLDEYGIGDLAFTLNREAAAIARRMADAYTTADKPRFVAGSIGPTTKLPSLAHIGFDAMRDAYAEQVAGLIEGGVDLLCVETCQDMLQVKAALAATRHMFEERGIQLPVIVSVTIETMGTMLMGTEIGAAVATIDPYDIVTAFGMNCATGPKEMEESLRYICQYSPRPVFVMPNAGIPENIGGHTCYKLTPDELESHMRRFITEFGVSIIGGCCGTTAEHIARLARLAGELRPAPRDIDRSPMISSLYAAVPMHLDPPPLLIGERCNANGSKRFRELLLEERYDDIVAMAKEQIREGAHLLDVCVAYVGRDERRDMREVVSRFNTQVSIPLMIDSTELDVLEEALKHYAGKAIVNSVNLEDGTERVEQVFALCKRYGAAVVALTIDEDGMAKTAHAKFDIAARIRDIAVHGFGLRDEDLVFDTLTFTLGSGDEEFRRSAIETVEAIRLIKQAWPRCFTSLGVSNVSFGLNPHARHVLNSVFMHYACEAGLDMAIVHASKIMPLYRIDERGRAIAMDLIMDRREWEAA